MHTKYVALESNSKILIEKQNQAVSEATFALSNLGSRLNDLVEQLAVSYNICKHDFEVIY